MIPGFITPKEGDKDTWPPEGWRGTLKLEYFNGEIEYTDTLHLFNLKFTMTHLGTIYKSVQWLDETPCTEQVRELLDVYNEYVKLLVDEIESLVPIAHVHGWRSERHEHGVEIRSRLDPLIQTVEKLLK